MMSDEGRPGGPSQGEPVVSPLRASVPDADPTALSYWFPKIEAAGLPVPRTLLVSMSKEAQRTVLAILWGEDPDTAPIDVFEENLKSAALQIGSPCFLRTDHTSGKHLWRKACFVENVEQIGSHVLTIAEYSEMAGIVGLPYSTWAVRELLPTISYGVCPNFDGMPVAKEFRAFVDGGAVECLHPYWPREALQQGGCNMTEAEYSALCDPNDDTILSLAAAAGKAVGGRWSVDLLATERGWFITDMAEAGLSYHWPDCPAQTAQHIVG